MNRKVITPPLARPQKKERGDSPLRGLSEEKRKAIFDHSEKHTLAATRLWIFKTFKRRCSESCLRKFRARFEWDSQFSRQFSHTEILRELLAKRDKALTIEELDSHARLFFATQAVQQQSPGTYLAFLKFQHQQACDRSEFQFKERELAIRERQTAVLEKKARMADDVGKVLKENITDQERLRRIDQILGIEPPKE